jgi:hypothetical protein
MNKKADLKRIFLYGVPLLLLAVGVKMLDDEARILWFEQNGTDHSTARFYYFSGEKERAFDVEAGERIIIFWEPRLRQGSLRLELFPPDGEAPLSFHTPQQIEFVSPEKGRLRLKVTGVEARGNFSLRWEGRGS